MVISTKTSVSSLYRFFKVPKEFSAKLSASKLSQLDPDGSPGWTALAVSRECNPKLLGKNAVDEALVRQWIEYAVTYAVHIDDSINLNQVFRELNEALVSQSYIATNYLTTADLLLFFILHPTIATLSYAEKECYQNLSRWFDHLQLEPSIRQSRQLVKFSRTPLYA